MKNNVFPFDESCCISSYEAAAAFLRYAIVDMGLDVKYDSDFEHLMNDDCEYPFDINEMRIMNNLMDQCCTECEGCENLHDLIASIKEEWPRS